MLSTFRSILTPALAFSLLAACEPSGSGSSTSVSAAIAEVKSRPIEFPSYPQANQTYLSFSSAHGFQVNYLGTNGRAWLWYPGNSRGVPEEYRLQQVRGIAAICWRHPGASYNPVTKQVGGEFACQSLDLSRRTIIARLAGDPFNLATGKVPYRLDRCKAPPAFEFDRNRYAC